MSSGFTFGAKPGEGQGFAGFGAPQPPTNLTFGVPTSNTTALPQFAPAFGAGTSAGLQFASPTATTTSSFLQPSFNFNTPSATASVLKPTFASPTANTGMGLGTAAGSNMFGNQTNTFGAAPTMNLSFNMASPNTSLPFGASKPTVTTSSSGMFATALSTFPTPGLSFGASPSNTANTFGSKALNFGNTVPGSQFGNTAAVAANTGLNFGGASPAPNTGLTIGTAPAAPGSGMTFGTTLNMPNSSGLTFGQPTTNTGFGTSTINNPTAGFGVAAPTMITTTGFGTPATTVLNTGFGSAPITMPNSGFGAVRATPANTGFGTIPNTAFGAQISTVAPSSGLSLGNTTAAPTTLNTGLTFGGNVMPTATSNTGLSFNTATSTLPMGNLPSFATTTIAPTTKLTFGPSMPTMNLSKPTLSTTALTFNSAKIPASNLGTSTSLTFTAVSSTTAATSTFNVATTSTPGLSFNTTTTAASTLLNFTTPTTTRVGTTTATTDSPSVIAPITANSLGFGVPTTSTGLAFDLSSSSPVKLPTTTTATPSLSVAPVSAATTSTTVQPSVGLGGISATPAKQSVTTTAQSGDVAPRDQVLPNELLQTVENFKKYVQEQKSFSSEIARFSVRDIKKIELDIDLVAKYINEMETDLQKNKAMAEKIKFDTAKGLQHVEMAQRTFDTPSGLQYENTSPLNYFVELADCFEKDMHKLKVHIDNIDKCVKNNGQSNSLSPEDLALGMRRLHETFVALAGRLQSTHNQVEYQKEQYLNLRKKVLNDYTNVFEERNKEMEALEAALDSVPYQPPTVYTGPTPFCSLGNSQAQALAQNPPPAYPSATSIGMPSTGFMLGNSTTLPLFGSPMSNTTSSFTTPATSFQLQKPPVGNKRGKP